VSGLLDRPQAWDALRANGRRHVESVRNWRNSVAVYVDAYERVLAS
jgi:glycogen(starch) synthase